MAPGPRDEAGRDHLRASHADREQVIGTLKAAFVAGMLAKDEFDLWVGLTGIARSTIYRIVKSGPDDSATAHGQRMRP